MGTSEMTGGTGRDSSEEDAQVMAFAKTYCEVISDYKPSRAARLRWRLGFYLKSPFYLIVFRLWRQRVTREEARQIFLLISKQEVASGKEVCYAWYFVNWALWHLRKHFAKANLSLEDGKHAAFSLRAIWERTFAGNGDFFGFYEEVRARNFEEFEKRDRAFFMKCRGEILSKELAEALDITFCLNERSNKWIRSMFNVAAELVEGKKIKMFTNSVLAAIFTDDHAKWQQRIKGIRSEIGQRLEGYCDNMMRFCIAQNDNVSAEKWNQAICTLRHVVQMPPTGAYRAQIASKMTELQALFNAAASNTYVLYRRLDEEQKVAQARLVSVKGKDKKGKGQAKEQPVKVETIGRFEVEHYEARMVITDTVQKKKPYKIKKFKNSQRTKAYTVIDRLLQNYKTGTDQIVLSDSTWRGAFQKGRGDALRFKDDQIFIAPRWNREKGRYIDEQPSGRWRLWLDDELKMSERERIEAFKAAYPDGYPE